MIEIETPQGRKILCEYDLIVNIKGKEYIFDALRFSNVIRPGDDIYYTDTKVENLFLGRVLPNLGHVPKTSGSLDCSFIRTNLEGLSEEEENKIREAAVRNIRESEGE